jgi:hypothetical protein
MRIGADVDQSGWALVSDPLSSPAINVGCLRVFRGEASMVLTAEMALQSFNLAVYK